MIQLNNNIENIKEGSILDIAYKRMLAGLNEASQYSPIDYSSSEYLKKNTLPDGSIEYVADTDKINSDSKLYSDIATKNAAYMFANAISGGINEGKDGSGKFVSINGDTMAGKLSTLYGFSAGYDGKEILNVTQIKSDTETKNIVTVSGELHLDSKGFFVGEKNILSYNSDVLSISGDSITFIGKSTFDDGIKVGKLSIDKTGISIDGNVYYHSGNSNNGYVDWSMKNGSINGSLSVSGITTLGGTLTSLYGVKMGYNGKSFVFVNDGVLSVSGNIDISGSYKIDGGDIISKKNDDVLSFSANGKIMNLGENTKSIALQSNICNDKNDTVIVSKSGDGCFLNSFQAGSSLGDVLIYTYKGTTDSGIVIPKLLTFGDKVGASLFGSNGNITFSSLFNKENIYSTIGYKESESLYKPANRVSSSLNIDTNSDFIVSTKPFGSKVPIEIVGTKTRLLDGQLFFNDSIYLQGLSDGIKHYGNTYITGSIGTQVFSSGFAGSGWRIFTNGTTGNTNATFDELTIRKKMRVYVHEVFWVSDSCEGDTVEEIL